MDDAGISSFEHKMEQLGKRSFWFTSFMVLINLPGLYMSLLGIVFFEDTQNINVRCKINELENRNWTFEQLRCVSQAGLNKKTVRRISNQGICSNINQCEYVARNYTLEIPATQYTEANKAIKYLQNKQKNIKIATCDEYVIADTPKITVFEEFDLVCNNQAYFFIIFVTSALADIVAGALIIPVGDILGRKALLTWGCNILMAGGLCTVLAVSPEMLGFGWFLLNIGFITTKVVTEVLLIEIGKSSSRIWFYLLSYCGLMIGHLAVPFIYSHKFHWRHMQWAVSSTLLFIPLIIWYVPESPRWYKSKDQNRRASDMLKTMKDPVKQNELIFQYKSENRRNYKQEIRDHFGEMKQLIFSKNYVLLNILFVMMGINLFKVFRWKAANSLGLFKKPYISVSLAFEVFNYIVPAPCLYLLGKKFSLLSFMLVSSLLYATCCMIWSATETTVFILVLIVAELSNSGAMIVASLYNLETAPTTHRCTATGIPRGIWIGFSKLFLITATKYVSVDRVYALVAATSCFGFAISLFLKEWSYEHLPETTEQVKEGFCSNIPNKN